MRFLPPTSGSLAFVGLLSVEDLHRSITADGTAVQQDLTASGYLGDALTIASHPLKCFIEAHIEQGPILEQNSITIGVVRGIQGARMFSVSVAGQDAHAGTTPMSMRRDALVGASGMITRLHQLASDSDPDMRLTVGQFDVQPNASSTIPGMVHFKIDLRHPSADTLETMENMIRKSIGWAADEADLRVEIECSFKMPPILFNETMMKVIRQESDKIGLSHRDMLSGAGHDAGNLAAFTPSAMIFVPCKNGVSHNEAESATPADLAAGANVLLRTMLACDQASAL